MVIYLIKHWRVTVYHSSATDREVSGLRVRGKPASSTWTHICGGSPVLGGRCLLFILAASPVYHFSPSCHLPIPPSLPLYLSIFPSESHSSMTSTSRYHFNFGCQHQITYFISCLAKRPIATRRSRCAPFVPPCLFPWLGPLADWQL